MTTGSRSAIDSVEERLATLNLSAARLGYLLSAALMPAGVVLDWITQREHALSFLWIRLGASLVALVLFGVSHLPGAKRFAVLLGAGPPLVCGTGIELMILRLGGYASPYYAGLNLCILAVGVLYTWRWWQALAVSGCVVGLWLAPTVPRILDGDIDFRTFFNNLYFLALTAVIAVASAVIRYNAARREVEATRALERATDDLGQAFERLRELDRLKSEFFANISHELRTPLTLILAPIDQLLAVAKSEPVRRSLEVVRRNAERLMRLIDDLLDLARLDVGGLRLTLGVVDLDELCRKVVDAAKPTASARSLELTFESEGVREVHGDRHRLEIVFTNLVSNALKFTPAGGHVSVRVGTEHGVATVEVTDDGPGVPEPEREKIFERFYQVEGSVRRRHGGAGIGLALARQLVNLHGGMLSFRPNPSGGSIFQVTLKLGREHFRSEAIERRRAQTTAHPSRRWQDQPEDVEAVEAPAEAAEVQQIPFEKGRRARVLVAEDQDDLREFLVDLLSRHFEVTAVEDGEKALTKTREERPDLVLTDVMMPNVSGVDLCRSIKTDPHLKRTAVIMLTARPGAEAALEGYSVGADDFVAKPFHTRVLLARIQAHLKLRSLSLQLADHSRLALAGTLAAGIAHEVRNPINAILNAARVLNKPARVPNERRLFEVIEEGAERVVAIVSALDEQIRPADGTGLAECDVETGIESALHLLEHRMKTIAVHKRYEEHPRIVASVREINQVILNLLDNAIRANPGNIWLDIGRTNGSVFFKVSDDGPGVPDEIAAHVFDPFVTTRPVGEGTGLGLYLSRRIVEEHAGVIRLERRPGGGAEFVVEIPVRGMTESAGNSKGGPHTS